ncbi:hypothetical protein JCM10450v2_002170 [Rhodotorula kratochvilovae]
MSTHRLYVRADDEPQHPSGGYGHDELPNQPPDALVRKWYRAPAAVAFKRIRMYSEVEVEQVGWDLYHEPDRRRAWMQAFVDVDLGAGAITQVNLPKGFSALNLGNMSYAKIDNWMSTIPLPLVLIEFDHLFLEPPSRAVNPRVHHIEAFAFLLLDLGLAGGTVTSSSCSAQQLSALTVWLEQHCPVAVSLWLWTYTHVYHNARTMAQTQIVPWATRLRECRLPVMSFEWLEYLKHLERPGSRAPELYSKADFLTRLDHPFSNSPVFTDLYLVLHPNGKALIDNATSTNHTPRLPHPHDLPPAVPDEFNPEERGTLKKTKSSIFKRRGRN